MSAERSSKAAVEPSASAKRKLWLLAAVTVILISSVILSYVLLLLIAGASWSVVPESQQGSTAVVFQPVPVEWSFVFVASTFALMGGVVLRLRGRSWGLLLAWTGEAVLLAASAVLIFGAFGPIFLGALALLIVLAIFTWLGWGMPAWNGPPGYI